MRAGAKDDPYMTRRVVIGVLLATLILAALLAPWTISSRRIGAALARQLAPYGLRVEAGGRAAVALLPVPRVRLADLAITDRNGATLLTGSQLRGDLDIGSLLTGTVALDAVTLIGGRLAVAVDRDGRTPWRAFAERDARRGDAARPEPLRRLTLTGVAVDITDERRGFTTSIDTIDLFALRAASGGLAGSANLVWRGQPLEAVVETADVARLLAGLPQAIDIKVTSPLLSLSASGVARIDVSPVFDGPVAVRVLSMSRMADWLVPGAGSPDLDRPAAISGTAAFRSREIAWPQVQLDLGADRLEGALQARLDEASPALRATLAAGTLDFGWLARALRGPARAWASDGGSLRLPAGAVVDLRLSASDLALGAVRLRDGAGSVLVEGGRLDLSLLRATIAGGVVKGRLSTALSGGDLKGQVSVERVDVASALRELALPATLSGTVGGQASFETPEPGKAGSDLRGHLAGRVTATIRDGDMGGLNAADAIRHPAGSVAFGTGRTAFARAALDLTFLDGVGHVTEGALEGTGLSGTMDGTVSLPDGTIDLTAGAASPERRPARLVLRMVGPWSAPHATARVEALPSPSAEPDPILPHASR